MLIQILHYGITQLYNLIYFFWLTNFYHRITFLLNQN